MIKPAGRVSAIQEYYFSRKLKEVARLNKEGQDIISLAIGSPDMPPSEQTIDKLCAVARQPDAHGYQPTSGLPELRRAMAAFYRRIYNVELDPQKELQPIIGSKEGIMYVTLAFCNAGDAVLVPDPGYPTYTAVNKLFGTQVIKYNLRADNGWQPDFVLDAVRRQLDLGYEIGPQHPLAGPVTELVCEMTGFDRAALCNTGSEAVMGAVRIARTVTGRERIAVFAGSYHGIFDEVIVRLGARGRAMPAAPGIMPNTAANVVILEYGEPDALQWVRDNADNLAAVLVEPVQSRRPDLQPREFLHELRRITAESGSLLIFDEVVTGFRTGPGGAQAHFDVRADLASYGKVIGGGFPIGIIAGKRQYMDALDGGAWQYGDDSIPTVGVTYFAGTFVRHPLALAACHAVLSYLKEAGPELQRKLTETTTQLADSLNAFCQEHGAPIAVKHFASVWRIVFTEDHPYQDLLFAMMRSRGIHILDNFPCFMTTAHSEADVEAIRKAFCDSVLELQADGFLPGKPVQNAADASASFDPTKPPVPGARLGRDAQGKAAWFIADPDRPGSYMQLKTSV